MSTHKKITYTKIKCQSACNKVRGGFPYTWDLNVYRGCIHGCQYCYALYSHAYMNLGDFYHDIYIKENILEQLEKQLSHPNWKREIINLGGVTDNYQAVEAQYQLMPEILKLLIKYKTPAIISTKSDLLLRDYDLIGQLAKITYVNIAATITCMDRRIEKLLEPKTISAKRRFTMLKEFKQTHAITSVHFMPIIPYITDTTENIEQLFAQAKNSQIDHIITGMLYLKGPTKPHFFHFIHREFPHLHHQMALLYHSKTLRHTYKTELYQKINHFKDKYKLSYDYKTAIRQKTHYSKIESAQQLSFEF
ncbi:radical SAM protein [Neisseria sp. Ec49-e6-T10]|uniref:SPL family radical SAM protein n=1 Tax=Neisseria sp. Ec49-e6-T10 TaxID=3140744 RepID=UPI003EBC3211